MDDKLAQLRSLAKDAGTRTQSAQAAVRLVRSLGPYRWAGLYDVTASEIGVIAWGGPQPPTFPRFPIARGLNGSAVAVRAPVIVRDGAADGRYLTIIDGTRGEMIQPVLDSLGIVVGTIDIEADRVNAFSARDETLMAECALALQWLWL